MIHYLCLLKINLWEVIMNTALNKFTKCENLVNIKKEKRKWKKF